VIFISHRLGFARRADRILVFEDGRIAEEGTHEELLGQNGIYADMYASQTEWYTH
jgi:ATP-binding cassette subfamily B protein